MVFYIRLSRHDGKSGSNMAAFFPWFNGYAMPGPTRSNTQGAMRVIYGSPGCHSHCESDTFFESTLYGNKPAQLGSLVLYWFVLNGWEAFLDNPSLYKWHEIATSRAEFSSPCLRTSWKALATSATWLPSSCAASAIHGRMLYAPRQRENRRRDVQKLWNEASQCFTCRFPYGFPAVGQPPSPKVLSLRWICDSQSTFHFLWGDKIDKLTAHLAEVMMMNAGRRRKLMEAFGILWHPSANRLMSEMCSVCCEHRIRS